MRENLPALKKLQIKKTEFPETTLPDGAMPIDQALATPSDDLLAVAEYVLSRRLDPTKYYWTGKEGLGRRFIIPFTYENKVVGWTARSIDNLKTAKYLTNIPGNYVYGLDRQSHKQKLALVVEGPLDADAVNACALLHAEISSQQRQQLAELELPLVLVPDRDSTGLKLAEQVLELGWKVSLPVWHNDVKDVADAAKRYGVPFTIASIVQGIEPNNLKAKLKIRSLQAKVIDKSI